MSSPLQFVVLGPNGPELTSKRPAGFRTHTTWGVWWFDHDTPSGKTWPPHTVMKTIGEDFVPRGPGDFGLMGVIRDGDATHEENARQFIATFQLKEKEGVVLPKKPCTGCRNPTCSLGIQHRA